MTDSLFVVAFDILSIFLSLVFHISFGIVLYELSKVNNLESKGLLAFLPIFNIYLMCLILGDRVYKGFQKYFVAWYSIFFILSLFISKLDFVTAVMLFYLIYLFLKEFYISNDLSQKLKVDFVLSIISFGLYFVYISFKYKNHVFDVSEEFVNKRALTLSDYLKLLTTLGSSLVDKDSDNSDAVDFNNSSENSSDNNDYDYAGYEYDDFSSTDSVRGNRYNETNKEFDYNNNMSDNSTRSNSNYDSDFDSDFDLPRQSNGVRYRDSRNNRSGINL